MAYLKSWSVILVSFLTVQGAVVVLNSLSGFVLVRFLPKSEYGWLTVANTLAASLMVFVEPVAGVGLNALAAPVCGNRDRMGQVLSAASRLQWRLLLMGVAVFVPWSFLLLRLNGAMSGQAMVLCLIVVVTIVLPQTVATLHGVFIRLRGDWRTVYHADLIFAGGRLVCTLVTLKVQAAAAAGLLATGAAQIAQTWFVRRQSAAHVDICGFGEPQDKTALLQQWRHLAPVVFFQCVQAQLGPWILGLRGNVGKVADLGALLRFGVVLAVGGVFAQQILIPALARDVSRSVLGKHLRIAGGGFVLAGAALLAVCSMLPSPFLWVLGSQYMHLSHELVLIMGFFLVSWLATVAGWLNAARGWVAGSWQLIPATLAVQALGFWLLPLSTLAEVITFLIISLLPQIVVQTILCRHGWKMMQI